MTTTTLRPNATVATGAGTTAVGGTGTMHGVTSDNSDSSYMLIVTHTAGADPTKLDLGTVSLPAGAITKTIKISGRGRADTLGTAPRTYKLGLRVFNVLKSAFTTPDNTTSLQTFAGPTVGLYLSQTDIDNAQIWVTAVNGGCDIRVAEIYLDVTYALKPTTAVTAPSGTVSTTTMPTVQWTHTPGTDGTGQNRYWVKIFTSAVYSGGGFDPETSTAAWDSGSVLSTADSAVPPTPLANSTTYRAYVKTAQNINGILQWADWAFSGFDIAVTPPTITSVVPTVVGAAISVAANRNTGGAAWDHVTVERSKDGGATWAYVRGATYDTTTGDVFTVVDYEAPLATSVLYRAQAFAGVPGLVVSSPYVQAGSSVQWSSTSAWLKALNAPTLNRAVALTEAFAYNAEVRSGVFQVLGRSSPVVVADTASSRRGQLTLLTGTRTEADDLRALLRAGGTMLLQTPASWDIAEGWFVVTGFARQHLAPAVAALTDRVWTVDVIEVDRPPDTSSS